MVANQTCPAEGARERFAKDGPGSQGWNRLAHQPPVRFYHHNNRYTICVDKRKRGLDKNESEGDRALPDDLEIPASQPSRGNI